MIFQDKKVESSLTEVQPTSGIGKVHIRRKRQSMVMACKLAPPRYLLKERKSSNNLRQRIMQLAHIVWWFCPAALLRSGEVSWLQRPLVRPDATRTHECVSMGVRECVREKRAVVSGITVRSAD